MRYRRCFIPGGTYFFTLVTFNRTPIFQDADTVDLLRGSFHYVEERHPFHIDAYVIMPEHIHMIWTLPETDTGYPLRMRLMKSHFTHTFVAQSGMLAAGRGSKQEQAIWQRRYWEHWIRDADDLRAHVEYIHANPVKHGLAAAPAFWPYSSFHQYAQDGMYPHDWAMADPLVRIEGDM